MLEALYTKAACNLHVISLCSLGHPPRTCIPVKSICMALSTEVASGFFPSCLCHLLPQAFSLAQISGGEGAKWGGGGERGGMRDWQPEGLLPGRGCLSALCPGHRLRSCSQTVTLRDDIVGSGARTQLVHRKAL